MSYQYDSSACAPTQDDDDFHQQQIKKDLESAGSMVPATANFAVGFFRTLWPLILALGLVYFIAKDFNFSTFMIMILLAVMIYIFKDNMTGSNLAGSLPVATYPGPPHLGLDGVSLRNRTCLNC